MMEHRVRIRVLPWDDFEFHSAFERVCDEVRGSGIVLDSWAAAERCEAALRSEGIPTAGIEYSRTVNDVLHGVAQWLVRKDARPVPGPESKR